MILRSVSEGTGWLCYEQILEGEGSHEVGGESLKVVLEELASRTLKGAGGKV